MRTSPAGPFGRLAIALGALVVAASCTATAAGEPAGHVRSQEPVIATLPGVASSAAPTPSAPVPTAAVVTAPPTAAPGTPSAAPSSAPPTAAAPTGILAAGKQVYDTAGEVGCVECHGPAGKGGVTKLGDTAPDIRGATEVKLRNALGGGVAVMSFIKLSEDELEAVLAYLTYLNQQP